MLNLKLARRHQLQGSVLVCKQQRLYVDTAATWAVAGPVPHTGAAVTIPAACPLPTAAAASKLSLLQVIKPLQTTPTLYPALLLHVLSQGLSRTPVQLLRLPRSSSFTYCSCSQQILSAAGDQALSNYTNTIFHTACCIQGLSRTPIQLLRLPQLVLYLLQLQLAHFVCCRRPSPCTLH
jgi:hypothetical protein